MANNHDLARLNIMTLPPYVAGKPIEEVKREYGLTDIVKLASNENPLKTSPKAILAMKDELENCYIYPEGSSPSVREALSGVLNVSPDMIMVGNGGDHVINLIGEAFLNQDDEVIVATPSFITHELTAIIMGAKLVRVPLVDFHYDLDAMLAAITDRTKLIVICNPNNPTGTIVRRNAFEAFLKKVPKHCIVIMDEAYFEYVEDPDYPNGIDYIKQGFNVICVRTFSKLYGLAGNRIGYAVCAKNLMDVLTRVQPPFPVNRIAQAGAVAALGDDEFLADVLHMNREGRKFLCEAFDRLNLTYCESHGNFILFDSKIPNSWMYEKLLQKGVILRPCGAWGYPTSFRITIGTEYENKKTIEALTELIDLYERSKND